MESLPIRGALIPFLILLSAPAWSRPKTDVVVLDNGNRIACEMKKLQRGKLTISTDASGTITVKWSHVAGVQSTYLYQIVLDNGDRRIGRFDLPPELGQISVANGLEAQVVDVFRVVEIVPMEDSFWSRVRGSVDAGFDFAQASSATTWSASAELNHRTPRRETRLNLNSNIQQQEGAEDVNRQDLKVQWSRYFENRWFAAGIGQGEKSESQGLDLRLLVGGGVGKKLLQTNRTNVAVLGGAALSQEKYEDQTEYQTNAEIVASIGFDTFRFDHPELELSSSFAVLPNLLTLGRYRLQANGKARIEIIRNFYWSISVYESYDSDPPSETSRRNDFGINVSIGWKFN
jgi:hypothetical protein